MYQPQELARSSLCNPYMSHSFNSLKGVIWGSAIGVTKRDIRSLDSSLYDYSMVFSKTLLKLIRHRYYGCTSGVEIFTGTIRNNIMKFFIAGHSL